MANDYSYLSGLTGNYVAPDVRSMMAQSQALRQAAMQTRQPQMIGQYLATPPLTSSLASLGDRFLSGVLARRAQDTESKYRSQLAAALMGESPTTALQGLSDNPYAHDLLLRQAMQAPQEQWKTLMPEDAAALGLPDGVWQVSPEGQIKPAYQPEAPEAPGKLIQDANGNWVPNPAMMKYEKQIAGAGKPETTVNVGPTGVDYGQPEKGLVWARNPDGTVKLDERGAPIGVPYQGGSVYESQKQAEEAAQVKQGQEQRYADTVTDAATRAEKLVSESSYPTTGMGSYLSAIPGTGARDLAGLVDTIRANVGFDRLQQMRNSSPTGGALGQVSELENRLLQSTLGNLEQSQSKEQFLYNLRRVKKIYEGIVNGVKDKNGEVRRIQPDDVTPAKNEPEVDDLLNKYAPQ